MARTRSQDYDAKRLAILRASAKLFARHGYAGTSITMIAEACGASKALLYHYYPDKESVLFDVLSTHLKALVAAVEAAAQAPDDRLGRLAEALLEAYRDADAEHQVQIAGLRLLPPERQDSLKALERRLVAPFSEAIAEAVPQLAGSPRLAPVTMSLFGMLNWHYLWFREGGALSRAEYARLAVGLIEAGGPAVAEAPKPDARRRAAG
jgi:AcrR family transcriptional regulator